MIIKRLHFKDTIISLGYLASVDSSNRKIVFDKELQVFFIDDKIMIPISEVKEALVEYEPIKPSRLSKEEIVLANKLPEDKPVKSKDKV